MKLPRWLVILLLSFSLLAVLAAAGWWWVIWPERTAREFVELMAADDWHAAQRMCRDGTHASEDVAIVRRFLDSTYWVGSVIRAEPRTTWDLISANQVFTMHDGLDIHVARGYIELIGEKWSATSSVDGIFLESSYGKAKYPLPSGSAGGESPGQIDKSPGQIDGSPYHIDESPGHIDESPGHIDKSPGQIDGSPCQIDGSPGQIDESPCQIDE